MFKTVTLLVGSVKIHEKYKNIKSRQVSYNEYLFAKRHKYLERWKLLEDRIIKRFMLPSRYNSKEIYGLITMVTTNLK